MSRPFTQKRTGLILGSTLIIIACFTIYLFSCWYKSATQEALPVQGSNQTWRTITNEKYNFSIDIPTEWRVRMFPNGNHGDHEAVGRMTEPARCNWGCIRLGTLGNGVYIAHKEINNPDVVSISNWAEERIANKALDGEYELDNIQEIEVDGQTLWIRHYLLRNRISGEMEPAIDSFILREQDAFILTLDALPRYYEGLVPVFYAITSHFRSLSE